MPDSTGRLTQAEKQKVLDWVRARTPTGALTGLGGGSLPQCPVCQTTRWIIGD
jgi:hypothetical protein